MVEVPAAGAGAPMKDVTATMALKILSVFIFYRQASTPEDRLILHRQ